jgi:NTE family protein
MPPGKLLVDCNGTFTQACLLHRSMDMQASSGQPGSAAALPLPPSVALVLQGGGALGSFQAGVVQSLGEHDIPVNWVAGISIGAINAAIIAGNAPGEVLSKLSRFWDTVSGSLPNFMLPPDNEIREAAHLMAAATVAAWGVPGMFRPNWLPSWWAPAGSREALSYYDTAPLREMLDSLVDWDRINFGPVRLSVGAVDVQSGNFYYFDNRDPQWQGKLNASHIMASAALPPGLPPIEIEGRFYWDGGIVSNTPLAHVLDHQEGDTLIFQCDLFPAEGPMPREMSEVWSRQKDIQYSSRTRQVTDVYLRLRREHEQVRRLLAFLPEEVRTSPDAMAVEDFLEGGSVNIVHLIYRSRAWESGARDFEFSRAAMLDHWAQGQAAVAEVIAKGNKLLARNILDGKSATFDLQGPGHIKEKQA